ncbi:MAG: hypothetical protein ACI8ZM_001321 [Crocinitomix sp.]|jgi:hypothetical protein
MKIEKLMKECSDSVIANGKMDNIRGGRGIIETWSKTDECSDSNGDGTADDCNNEPDDPTEAVGRR